MTFIRHVTIDTGHTRDSYRCEISDEAMQVASSLIAAGDDEPVAVPHFPATVSIQRRGRCMTAVVYHEDGMPLVTIGVAGHSRCARQVWELMHARYDVETPERPPAPWCAALLREGLAYHPDEAHWLGDFERCLAWAWVSQ